MKCAFSIDDNSCLILESAASVGNGAVKYYFIDTNECMCTEKGIFDAQPDSDEQLEVTADAICTMYGLELGNKLDEDELDEAYSYI